MAAARAGDDDVGSAREEVDREMLIGGNGVEARLCQIDGRIRQRRNMILKKGPDDAAIRIADGSILDVGVNLGPAVPLLSRPGPDRAAFRRTRLPPLALVDEDGKPAQAKRASSLQDGSKHLLPRDLERN